MVAFFCPPPFIVSSRPIDLQFHGAYQIAPAATVTINDVDIGDPSPDRLVIINTHLLRAAAISLSSGTVGGVSLTKHIDQAGTNSHLAMSDALVPNGSTATVVLNLSANPGLYLVMGVYSLRNYKNITPVVGSSAGGGDTGRSSSVVVPENGVALMAATRLPNTSTVWTTNLSEDYKETTPSYAQPMTGISGVFPAGGTATGSVTCRAIGSLAYS